MIVINECNHVELELSHTERALINAFARLVAEIDYKLMENDAVGIGYTEVVDLRNALDAFLYSFFDYDTGVYRDFDSYTMVACKDLS